MFNKMVVDYSMNVGSNGKPEDYALTNYDCNKDRSIIMRR